jgi:hypothetical protein
MKDLSNIVLKNGIQSLIYESEEAFQKSLVNTLSFKLNEAINEAKNSFAQNLLVTKEETQDTKEIQYFANFVENYDPVNNYSLKLKNNNSINIKEQELEILKEVFNALNSKNRQTMVSILLTDEWGIKKTISFYKKAKEILK